MSPCHGRGWRISPGQHDDRAAFRRFVGERGELRRIGQFLLGDGLDRRNSVAWRLPSVMVPVLSSSSRIDVAGGFDGAAGHRQHVEAHQAVHAGQCRWPTRQGADGGRDQGDEQRDQHGHRDIAAG